MRKNSNLLARFTGIQKLALCFLFAALVFTSLMIFDIDIVERVILAWDTFCLSMILLSWMLFFRTDGQELSDVVEEQDEGLKAIFLVVLTGVCFSLFGTLLLLTNLDSKNCNRLFYTAVSLSPVMFSWALLHTVFTTRYAHLYHDHNRLDTGTDIGGIAFPGKEAPDYLDFAYFSFVIGMTFQVSDVVIQSKVIRRFVLMHSIISFVFNTIIVALTINSIAGLSK
jgi:uncharacterized membrane protein